MRLSYKAVTRDGKIVTGIIEANDIKDASVYLRNKELIPVKIEKEEKNEWIYLIPIFKKGVKSKDVILFTRQMASMLNSGLTLVRSLGILKDQMGKQKMGEVIGGIISDIEEGLSFSSALLRYPHVFSPIYTSLIKASEMSGLLDKSLLRLADNLEKQKRLRDNIRGALIYPIIIVVLMVIVAAAMLFFVIPQLGNLYKDLNIELPLPTRIVIGTSHLVISFWPFVLGIGLITIFAYSRFKRTEEGKILIDNFLLKIPILGTLIRKKILTEVSRTLGLLIGSGALVVESLIQTSDIAGNTIYKNAIMDISEKVEKGVTVSDAMSIYDSLFPPILVQLVKVGEQTGKLDETFMKSSEYFEQEVDDAVKNLTTAMEPIIMVILGVGVGFLIISVITPIYNLTSSIGK